ncbi:CaiB/BaiF CoA transferase family protein [Variovorax sp. VNK109]|uniref:CaiB/BaiF CoA transferase family protein n=1 Tax=Variovorax sp. VNK109 TaxID=3400919 RepID=UPI003C0EA03B
MTASTLAAAGPLPLAGLRLLDFSQGVAGPYAAMLLTDLGADAIKVEPPEGDWSRAVGSLLQPHESSTHMSLNRGKRSVCLDLKLEEGRRIAVQLAARSDILVQNFRPGVMQRFGLDYDTLATANPRIVYGSISGFGKKGPMADAPATDSVMQAFGGLMSINGEDGGPPLRMGNMVSDMLAGSYLSQGILAALLALNRNGRGQHVSVSLLDSLVAFQSAPVAEYMLTGLMPRRSGRDHPLIAPAGAYAVKDGFVTLVATQPLWPKFCFALGIPELARDPRFASNEARLAHREMLQAIIAPIIAGKTRAEMTELAGRHDLACAPINDYDMLLKDGQVAANELIRRWTHPTLGEQRAVRNPVCYSSMEPAWNPPPTRGQHTQEVLAELGQVSRMGRP